MNPFLKWAGSKRQLLPELLSRSPATYGTYYEPFVGAGAMFFALAPKRAKLSDVNSRLIATYIAVRDRVEEVIRQLKYAQSNHSESFYYQTRARLDVDTHDDVAIASWLIYLNKTCFNGLYRVNQSGHFNVPMGRYVNPKICDEENLRACSAALAGCEIVCADFRETMADARAGDFVYCDPPYVPLSETSSFTAYTKEGFTPQDQQDLASIARSLKERGVNVMLSNSSSPSVVKQLYTGFTVDAVKARRSINSKAAGRGAIHEYIIL